MDFVLTTVKLAYFPANYNNIKKSFNIPYTRLNARIIPNNSTNHNLQIVVTYELYNKNIDLFPIL